MSEEDPHMRRLRQLDATLPDPEVSPALAMAIFESVPDAMVIVNMYTGNIRYVNGAAEFLFGYHRSELVGQRVEILVPEDYRDAHYHDVEVYALNPRIRPMSHGGRLLQGRHKTGEIIDAYISLAPISVPEGQFVLSIIRPFTGELTAVRLGDDPPSSP